MVRATWYLCLAATVTVAVVLAGRSQSSWSKKRQRGYSVSSRPSSRESLDHHHGASLRSDDEPRGGKSRVFRRAEAKARKGVEDDPDRRTSRNKKAEQLEVSRAIEELDAVETNPAEGAQAHWSKKEESNLPLEAADGEKSQAPAAEARQAHSRFLPTPATEAGQNDRVRQAHSRFLPPNTAPEDRSSSEAASGDRFSPQAPPANQVSPQAGKNRFNLEVSGDRFTPPAGRGDQVGSEGSVNNNLGPESNTLTAGAEQEINTSEAGRNSVTSRKSKYAIPEIGVQPSPESSPKNGLSPEPTGFAPEEEKKSSVSTERNRSIREESDRGHFGSKEKHSGPQPSTTNRFAPQEETENGFLPPKLTNQPKETSQVMNDQNHASETPAEEASETPGKANVTPGEASETPAEEASATLGEESNVTPGDEGSAAKSQGRVGTVSTDPPWLAWYNIYPWRQEMLSEYGEMERPSRAVIGL